jgi:GAF domain
VQVNLEGRLWVRRAAVREPWARGAIEVREASRTRWCGVAGVLERLLDIARDLTGARYAAVGVLDERRERLADFITAGIGDRERVAIGELPSGRGVLGLLISDCAPVRVADVAAHLRSCGFPPGHPVMRTLLGVPVLVGGEAWGHLYLAEKEDGGAFDEAEEESAVVLASWAAIAVENARRYGELRDRRFELERSVRAPEAAVEIAGAFGGETGLGRVLELLAERARALVRASAVAILLLDGEEFEVAAAAGEVPRELVRLRVPKTASSRAGAGVGTFGADRRSRVAASCLVARRGCACARWDVRAASVSRRRRWADRGV